MRKKFAKRKPDSGLKAEAMNRDSTTFDRGEQNHDVLGGMLSAPSPKSKVADAIYGKGGQLGGG
jgi:hypothetical protein